ncbi:hypothetical protein SAMN05421636_11012 [Pricia antarctica]|uniref:Uncharacterized protein n=1 Tax=Pricia antarctica TaxID=641691 RepID=A0A1G7HQL2_9FLAO|nr:hypothetical protein [Pricia antarctica]SDF02701.1 hypothetical protein SAMN05421636_11012 [Pricia antarctica]
MKKSAIAFTILFMLILNGCNQNPDVNVLLQNVETRNAIFKALEDNKDYMTAFMGEMQTNENAMQMMQGGGMEIMMNDSTLMKNMIHNMMGHKGMKHAMMQQMMNDSTSMNGMMQMHKNGMMSNECMQSCMKMMNKKK